MPIQPTCPMCGATLAVADHDAVVEMAGAGIHWMEPRDWDTTGPDQPGSYHPGVVNVLYADGSVIAEER